MIHNLRQFLFNNFLYGEQVRQRRIPFAVYSLITPDNTKVWGIDISHWNLPPVDLVRMRDQFGMSFVIIKGCDGSLRSRHFDAHRQTAKDAGLPWGIYDWLYPNNKVSIDAQTTAWANQYNEDPPPLGIFIDAEWTKYAGLPANPSANDLRMAHDKLKPKINRVSHTYTAKGYADTYLIGFDWSREPLWVANYGVNSPNLPTGAQGWHYWQFASTLDGHLLDSNGNAELDGNYYNGTHEQFKDEYNLGGTQPPPPGGDMSFYKQVYTSSIAIRNLMKYSGSVGIGQLNPGDIVEGVLDLNVPDTITQWVEISRIWRVGASAWETLSGFCSGYTKYMLETGDPAPPANDTLTVNAKVTGFKAVSVLIPLEKE